MIQSIRALEMSMISNVKDGDRIKVMSSTIYPVKPGATGTIIGVTKGIRFVQFEVRLDNRQILSVVPGLDDFSILRQGRS